MACEKIGKGSPDVNIYGKAHSVISSIRTVSEGNLTDLFSYLVQQIKINIPGHRTVTGKKEARTTPGSIQVNSLLYSFSGLFQIIQGQPNPHT
jgi:hypothetical protein